jgi:hypothetical protein
VILGLLSMLVANAAVTLAAISLTQRMSSGRRSVDVVVFLLCRYILIASTVLGAGLFHVLNPLALGLLGALGIVLWALRREYRTFPDLTRLHLGSLSILVLLIAIRALRQVWQQAPYSVDPLSYHLPKVALWIQTGALLPFPGADVRETFPAGFELLEAWWAVFLHHDVLIEMAGVEFLALGAAATAALARYAGIGERASALASILYALTPGIALQATACMNDAAVAAVLLATFALAASNAHPMLVLASVGVGLGIKPTFASAIPAASLLFVLERRTRAGVFGPPRWAFLPAVLGTTVGAFWYVRNLIQHGNPVFPAGSLDAVSRANPASARVGTLLYRLNEVAGTAVYDAADHYTVQFIFVAGWGLLSFACGSVALIATIRSSAPLQKLGAAFGLALLVALWIAPSGSFYLRFVLFVPALLAIATAGLWERLPRLAPILAVIGTITYLSAVFPGDLTPGARKTLSNEDWKDRISDVRFTRLPKDAVVACLYGTHDDSNGESYLAYGPGFTRTVVYLTGAESVEDLMSQLRARGVTWVFPQARNGDGSLRLRVLEAARRGFLLREDKGLYRVAGR